MVPSVLYMLGNSILDVLAVNYPIKVKVIGFKKNILEGSMHFSTHAPKQMSYNKGMSYEMETEICPKGYMHNNCVWTSSTANATR